MSCRTKPCGCTDVGLTTQSPCGHPDCPNPEKCAETFSGECIVYTGDTIVDVNIQYGDRFNEIVQKLALMITNPSCSQPDSTCQSVIGLMSTSITTTSVNIKWNSVPDVISYSIEYKTPASLTWNVISGISPITYPTQSINGLLPNTEYQIKVNTMCSLTSCFSLTILIRTKLI